jgi:hypothetical protein
MQGFIKIGSPNEFGPALLDVFLEFLILQGKVNSPSIQRLQRCKLLGAYLHENEVASIAAIKPKTASDFSKHKADLEGVSQLFEWELGYCYTIERFRRRGYARSLVQSLLSKTGHINLLATTELTEGNPMISILRQGGFVQKGIPWPSSINDKVNLGLFLRYNNEEASSG